MAQTLSQDRRDRGVAKPRGVDRHSGKIEAHGGFIRELLAEQCDMTRSHGRYPRDKRLRMGFPHGHRKTATLVAGQRVTGMVAPMVLDRPINGDWLDAFLTQVLVSAQGS